MKSTEGLDDTSWEPEIGYPPDLPEPAPTPIAEQLTLTKITASFQALNKSMEEQMNRILVNPQAFKRIQKAYEDFALYGETIVQTMKEDRP